MSVSPSKKSHPHDPRDTFIPGFDDIETRVPEEKFAQLDGPIWTRRKALLIQIYLQLFVYITKRGTYIDAFAGPQEEHRESNTWAARRIWESNPGSKRRRIHRLELFEKSPKSVQYLREMLAGTPADKREIFLAQGDSNIELPKRLNDAPVKGAAFCLLDQRSDECDWETVKAVASHKADPTKIELFYFVMAGWLDRYRAGLGDANREKKLLKWWGHEDFSDLEKAAPERAAELFAKRFKKELGYKYSHAYPIFDNVSPSQKGNVKFYMIHASDHPDARKLMSRSYKKLATGWDPDVKQEGMLFLESDLKAMLSGVKGWDDHLTADEVKKRKRRRP